MRYCRMLKGYGGKRDTKNLYKLMWCYESTQKKRETDKNDIRVGTR
jgi:hypothetical protein